MKYILAVIFFVLYVLGYIVFWGGALYVAWHFIAKVW